MSEVPCPGPCNARWRDAQEAYREAVALYDPLDSRQSRPEPPEIRPWYGAPCWCSPCASKISLRLNQLDDLASILQRYADGHRDAPDTPMVSGSPESMSPSQAQDAADDLARMFGGWEKAYRDLRGWPTARRTEDLASWVTTVQSWLAAKLTGIMSSAIAEDFGKEILTWHREMAGPAKTGQRTLPKPLRCPSSSCQQLTLTWVEGEDWVYCSNPDCRRVMAYTDYEAEVERRAGTGATHAASAA